MVTCRQVFVTPFMGRVQRSAMAAVSRRERLIDRAVAAVLLGCMCALIVVVGRIETWANLEPEGDQSSYLELAVNIADGRGFRTSNLHPMALDRGYDSPEAVRHPLYPYLLSIFVPDEPAQRTRLFPIAKAVSLGILALAPIAIYSCARLMHSNAVALVTACLTTINLPVLHYYSTVTVCEGLLLVLLAPTVMLLLAGFRRRPLWLAAGVLWGLSYLTKGTAALLVPAFAVAILMRPSAVRDWRLWGCALAVLLVCSPFLVRNTLVFGSPLFSYNSRVFWLDSWSHFYRPYASDSLPSLSAYVSTHSVGEVIGRLAQGAKWQLEHMAVAISPSPWLPMMSRFGILRFACACLMALAAIGAALRKNRCETIVLTCTAAVFFLAFSWYEPIVGTTARFYFPLAPVAYLCAADVAGRICGHWLGYRRAKWVLCSGVVCLLACVYTQASAAAVRTQGKGFYQAAAPNRGTLELLAWLQRSASADDTPAAHPHPPPEPSSIPCHQPQLGPHHEPYQSEEHRQHQTPTNHLPSHQYSRVSSSQSPLGTIRTVGFNHPPSTGPSHRVCRSCRP